MRSQISSQSASAFFPANSSFMSELESLIIRGIRSYDQAQKVDFYSPLTLICGHNGSGKTSIIESLKYSTTGELPPNSKQGAFIHDPKLSNENQTKAQVKLRFRNLNGIEMVCTRSIELTCTVKKYTTKTLESLLLIRDPETGHQYSISSKCSEIDTELPNHLGVSKPILENVSHRYSILKLPRTNFSTQSNNRLFFVIKKTRFGHSLNHLS